MTTTLTAGSAPAALALFSEKQELCCHIAAIVEVDYQAILAFEREQAEIAAEISNAGLIRRARLKRRAKNLAVKWREKQANIDANTVHITVLLERLGRLDAELAAVFAAR